MNNSFIFNGRIYLRLISIIAIIISLAGCSKGFVGKTFTSNSGDLYVKFVDDKTLEWCWDSRFRPEMFDYTLEEEQIRTVRKLFGLGQVWYLYVIDKNTLSDDKGNMYKFTSLE